MSAAAARGGLAVLGLSALSACLALAIRRALRAYTELSDRIETLSERMVLDREILLCISKEHTSVAKALAKVESAQSHQPSPPKFAPRRPSRIITNDHIAALPTASADDVMTAAAAANGAVATTSPIHSASSSRATIADPITPSSTIDALQEELLLRVLELLGRQAFVNAERVCKQWRALSENSLRTWPEWRARGASLSEATMTIPGVPAIAFGAAPLELSDDMRAACARATEQAAALPASQLELAVCGSQWTVLSMSASGHPTALKQHSARDYMLAACPASGLVYSGDKEGAIRVWDARTGRLRARVAFPGASLSALCASRGRLVVGDSQGQCFLLTEAGLLRGELDAISWRAHDGKVSALHCRQFDGLILSGGSDGGVRLWRCTQIVAMAFAGGASRGGGADADAGRTSVGGGCGRVSGGGGNGHEAKSKAAAGCGNADGCCSSSNEPKLAGLEGLRHPPPGNGTGSVPGCGGLRAASRVDLGLWAVSDCAVSLARHADTVIALARDGEYAYSGSREGVVLVSTLSGAPHLAIHDLGTINCLTAYHGKLLLCSDDGQQATLQLWDVVGRRRVQEVGGIRKWNAPTSIPYMGLDKSFWVRDNTLCTMNWMAIAGSDAMEPAA